MPKIIDFIEKKIPVPIINFISLLSGLIGIITWIGGVIKSTGIISEDSFFGRCLDKVNVNMFFLIVSAVFAVLLFFKCCVYYRDAHQRLYGYSRIFHEFTHKYRDLTFSLDTDLKKGALGMNDVVDRVARFTTDILDALCVVMSDILKKPIYGCIKLIDPNGSSEDASNGDTFMRTVSTFRRSSNTPNFRWKINTQHKDYVRDNTDFMELIDYNTIRNQFYQPDLIEYDLKLRMDDHEYRNSSSDWKSKYLSTAVFSIQISNKHLNISENEGYNVIGFLCFDSPERNTFKIKYKTPICDLAKAYADLFYCVFQLYSDCLKQIDTDEYKEKHIAYISSSLGVY